MRVGGNGHDDDAKKFWFVETYGCTCIIHQFTFGAFVTHRWMKGMPRFPRNAKEGSSLRTPDINWTFGQVELFPGVEELGEEDGSDEEGAENAFFEDE